MNIALQQPPKVAFKDYLSGQFDSPWTDCLWVDGEIVRVPPEYGQNNAIARYLYQQFFLHILQNGLPFQTCIKDTEIEVDGKKHQTRKPDLMVISAELDQTLRTRSAVVTKDMEPPLIIIEVVSADYRRIDLVDKEQEYLERQVPEYWTVDWDRKVPCIIVRSLHQKLGRYIAQEFYQGNIVRSGMLEDLRLNVNDILAAE